MKVPVGTKPTITYIERHSKYGYGTESAILCAESDNELERYVSFCSAD